MINKTFIALLMVPVAIAFWASTLRGFETDTHTVLSEQATDASQLNSYLTTVLPFEFPLGTGEEVGQGIFRTVRELIANVGAVNEDKPDIRSRTHFHDPTKAWAQAGLIFPPFGTFESSILWSQNPNQGSSGKHSWKDARDSYFNALTATNTTDRKKFYAETFESLGHLIHLVQDAATPAHTRNDIHLGLISGNTFGFSFLNVDRFHQWAKVKGEPAINSSASQPFDSSILNQTYNGLVPIAGIIDTTTTAGPATPSDATNIGIAEYSNANFFSDDTILRDYAYPNITQMELSQEAGPDGPEPRSYLRKSVGPGPTGYRAAVSTRLIDYIPLNFSPRQFELDDNVMADYGALLFPRAIGYSAGLIDYFFDGTVQNMLGHGWPENTTTVDYVPFVSVIYPDAPNQPSGTGTLTLVLYNKPGGVGPVSGPYVSQPVTATITPQVEFDPNFEWLYLTFDFSSNPLPAANSMADYFGYVVWRGPLARLGQGPQVILEQDAVVATVLNNGWN
jgi:hypothetical protein